jgi:hypothetical protein
LNIILDNDTRDGFFDVLHEIVELDENEIKTFSQILKSTKLNNIIDTIKLIQDRTVVIDGLEEMVFNKDLKANEVKHLQNLIEAHYWIFGEKYNLVTAAEDKFETALRNFNYLLCGENKKTSIDHIHRLREMDIFAVRQNPIDDTINNIVVELKHPNLTLGEKELSQIKRYMSVIIEQPEFNADNYTWDFILVGTKLNKYIKNEIKNNKMHGEKSLVYKVDNYRIFVRTWSSIINELKLRHQFLNEKLKIERVKLTTGYNHADEALDKLRVNSAKQNHKIKLPKI